MIILNKGLSTLNQALFSDLVKKNVIVGSLEGKSC
jgi:hypothetical protein